MTKTSKRKRRRKRKAQKTQVRDLDRKLHEEKSNGISVRARKRHNRTRNRTVAHFSSGPGQVNSSCYVRSILDPFNGEGVRIPSVGPTMGTETSSLFRRHAVSVITATSTERISGIVFTPNLTKHQWTVSSATSPSALTFTATDHINEAALGLICSSYRTVSFGFRLINIGAYLNQGAILFVGSLPAVVSNSSPLTDIYDQISVADDVRAFRAGDVDSEDLEVVWLPLAAPGSYVYSTQHGQSELGNVTANVFRSPSRDCLDNRPFFLMVGPSGSSDTLWVEEVMNIEMLYHQEDQYLGSKEVAIGSPDAISTSWVAGLKKMSEAGMSDFLRTGVRIVMDSAHSLFNSKGQTTMKALAYAGMAAGAALLDPKNPGGGEAKLSPKVLACLRYLRTQGFLTGDEVKLVERSGAASKAAATPTEGKSQDVETGAQGDSGKPVFVKRWLG